MAGKLDYIHLRDTFRDFLRSVNTTTATNDLSLSLTARVLSDNITTTDIDLIPVRASQFPYITMKWVGKSERLYDSKSTNASRIVEANLRLTACYQEYSKSEEDLINLVRNIETNLRTNIDLSAYVYTSTTLLYLLPSSVEFKAYQFQYQGSDSVYSRAADINVLFNLFVST